MKRAYLFPGQGSQKKGMGQDIFDLFPNLVEKASKILGYFVFKLCLEDPKNVLNQTQYTQPALYVVNALTYLKKVRETEVKPDFVAGHSLGEYTALFASGVVNFETGLRLVQKRAELMSRVSGGGMVAIIGFSEKQVREILWRHNFDQIDIANLNSSMQIVISGPSKLLDKAKDVFIQKGARLYVPLKVSGAFHSRYMKESAEKFRSFLDGFQFNEPQIPVISNVEAYPYACDNSKQLVVEQMTHPVRWTETIRYLMDQGVESFTEIGPGNVLTGLVEKIRKEFSPLG